MIIAVAFSIPTSRLLGNIAGLIFLKQSLALTISHAGIAMWLGLITLIALIATTLPTLQATDSAVSTALAYE